jgi:hypothetical protein
VDECKPRIIGGRDEDGDGDGGDKDDGVSVSVSAVAAELDMIAAVRLLPSIGRACQISLSPRHRMPFDSRNDGSNHVG